MAAKQSTISSSSSCAGARGGGGGGGAITFVGEGSDGSSAKTFNIRPDILPLRHPILVSSSSIQLCHKSYKKILCHHTALMLILIWLHYCRGFSGILRDSQGFAGIRRDSQGFSVDVRRSNKKNWMVNVVNGTLRRGWFFQWYGPAGSITLIHGQFRLPGHSIGSRRVDVCSIRHAARLCRLTATYKVDDNNNQDRQKIRFNHNLIFDLSYRIIC